MARPLTLETLPTELVLQIVSYLTPEEVAGLQRISRHMRVVCRDARFWRDLCFDGSKRATMLKKKFQSRAARAAASSNGRTTTSGVPTPLPALKPLPPLSRVEIKASWNPVFENEPVSWYNEYIQRHAPMTVNWFELPRLSDSNGRHRLDQADVIEVCGVALYRPGEFDSQDSQDRKSTAAHSDDDDDASNFLTGVPTLLAVAPLEDGSVCLWDVNGTVKRRGAIIQRSDPGLLFTGFDIPEGNVLPKFSVTECVSVDSKQHLAYFAVQNLLVEVDLKTLSVVGIEAFPRQITALSSAHPSVPLTVGTASEICIHDMRVHLNSTGPFKSVDDIMTTHGNCRPTNCATFPQPGPLSILHVPMPGSEDEISHDIYAAGRIPSILHYDRRNISIVQDAIHSGASLCGLAAIPYPFPTIEGYTVRSAGAQAVDSGFSREARPTLSGPASSGRTIVACGEYKSKGSLELYPIDPGQQHAQPMVNRQTSSFAKIFSTATHGKRLVISDGAGLIRWFERDGFTEARQCRLDGDDYDEDAELDDAQPVPTTRVMNNANTTNTNAPAASPELGDIARKLLPTQLGSNSGGGKADNDFINNDLLFWTGEKLGLISFSSRPGFRSVDFIEDLKSEEERAIEKEGITYRTRMRQLFKSAWSFGGDSDSDD